MDGPCLIKHNIDGSGNIKNLVTGQGWIHWTCRNVESREGHRHNPKIPTISEEIQRKEAACGLALDALLLWGVKVKKSIDVIAVLDVEHHLDKEPN